MLKVPIHYFLSLSLLFLITYKSYDQTKESPKSMFVEAESFFLFEEYKDALPLYQRIFKEEPDNYNVIYKIGICYLNDNYVKEKSIKYLKQASQHTDIHAVSTSYREKSAPLEALFFLGKAYRVNNMLDDAIKTFQSFKDQADPQVFDTDLVNTEINACQKAKKMLNDSIYFLKNNIGGPINTRFAESNPVISADGKTIIFNRALQFYSGVFISTKDSKGNWTEPVNLTADFGLDGDSYATGITAHGDEIFVYRSDQFDGNIYSSKLVNDKWSKLIALNNNINTRYWESHASPSPDGEYLYFTSNRPGGYGGLDIYRSKRASDGEWGVPSNLGPVINSPENEETPFLSNDGYTLFFSSQGHETMGGYDIFMSQLQSDGTWGKPKNMGYPLSTTGDDLFYCPSSSNSIGYYALYDPSSTLGLTDIYTIEIYNDLIPRTFTLKGRIDIDAANSKLYSSVTVKLIDPNTHQIVSQTGLENDGSYSLKSNQGKYVLLIEGPNFMPHTTDLNISLTRPNPLIDLPVIKLEQGTSGTEPIASENIATQKISAANESYSVTDTSALSIPLLTTAGSRIKVEVYNGSDLVTMESFTADKDQITYIFKPKPGENTLKFFATDAKGNVSATEVHVSYNPPVPPVELTAKSLVTAPRSSMTATMMILSSGELYKYLSRLDSLKFNNSFELYQYLVDHSNEEGFTKEDINLMFSTYYSQKSLANFDLEFRKAIGRNDTAWNLLRDSSTIPLQYLSRLQESGGVADAEMLVSLEKIMTYGNKSSVEMMTELNKYSAHKPAYDHDLLEGMSPDNAFRLYEDSLGMKDARDVLHIASTTEDLGYFYQDLLLASSGNLKNYLNTIQLNSNGINTSIDLVNHLFSVVGPSSFSNEELIRALDLSNSEKTNNLKSFLDLLMSESTGNLKSQLQSIDLKKNNINTYEDLLKYLLTQSQFKNIPKANVYELLIKLIGIKDVKEFADLINSYQNKAISKALADTSLTAFSTPLELLQYLLSSAQLYDYTESDINNMLIRMILEKGMAKNNPEKPELAKHKLWKNPAFFNTMILVDVILVLLILLFVLKKKKNR